MTLICFHGFVLMDLLFKGPYLLMFDLFYSICFSIFLFVIVDLFLLICFDFSNSFSVKLHGLVKIANFKQ